MTVMACPTDIRLCGHLGYKLVGSETAPVDGEIAHVNIDAKQKRARLTAN